MPPKKKWMVSSSCKCPFVLDCKMRFLKPKKYIRRLVMFQNVLSQCFLKKALFWNAKNLSKTCRQVSRVFANTKVFFINITVGNTRNDPNYPFLTNHKIHWKLKRQIQKMIVTICWNLHCQSHSQLPDLNLLTWLNLHQSNFKSHLVLGLRRERGIEDFWWN